MPSVHFDSASFAYTSARDVLSDVDLDIGVGWTGVVGANGEGKTTLLQLVNGSLEPTSGSVMVDGDVVITCRQTVDVPDEHVRALAESWDPPAFALRGRLEIEAHDVDRWPSLSPGERRRWQVGGALFAGPDVLLLDEPTNHLDAVTRDALIEALRRFDGVGLVVSHDRDLLDRLTDSTIRVRSGKAEQIKASYSVAGEEWDTADQVLIEEKEAAKRKLAGAERRLRSERERMRQERSAFTRRMQGAKAKDHDLHSTARKTAFAEGEAGAGRRLSKLTGDHARAAARVESIEVRRSIGGSIEFSGRPAPRRILVVHEGPLEAGGRVLVEDLDVTIERDTRLHIRGVNGAGKSTLLRSLADDWDLPGDRLLHLHQELGDGDGRSWLDRVLALPADERGRTLQLVARLGTDPDDLLVSDAPSPGETRKLALALALATEAWCLLLDEPTNHLDLPTVERLEEALAEYPGAVVIATHDHRFAEAVTDDVLELG